MKCPKCGFISFDYLSECKKCSANLVPVREKLGFSAFKPAMPAYLGVLLDGSSDTVPVDGAGKNPVEPKHVLRNASAELELGAALSGNIQAAGEDESSRILEPRGPDPNLTTGVMPQVDPGEVLELDWGEDVPVDPSVFPPESAESMDVLNQVSTRVNENVNPDVFTIELPDDDLEGPADSLDRAVVVQPKVCPVADKVLESAVAPGGAAHLEPVPDEEFVIELSDDDIEDLLLELEETAPEDLGEVRSVPPEKSKDSK